MLLKRIVIGIFLLSAILNHGTLVCSVPADDVVIQETIVEETQTPTEAETEPPIIIEYRKYSYVSNLSENDLYPMIEEIIEYIDYLESFSIDSTTLLDEIDAMNVLLEKYSLDLETAITERQYFEKCAEQYPEATQIWFYMKENFGWSDIVCAGIMGNIMAEIGGGSAEGALGFGDKWKIDKASGMGMFQWTAGRRKEIKTIYGNAPTIEQQLDFMYNELYGSNGVTKQVKSNELEAILNADTPEKVAVNFAQYFERCASFSYTPRKNYARFAYDYFVY
jgi:hypothetical protein